MQANGMYYSCFQASFCNHFSFHIQPPAFGLTWRSSVFVVHFDFQGIPMLSYAYLLIQHMHIIIALYQSSRQ